MENKQIEAIASAIKLIARGEQSGPTGLEMLSIAIAGDGLNQPIGEALNNIAEAINNVAAALGFDPNDIVSSPVTAWESLYQIAKIKTKESN